MSLPAAPGWKLMLLKAFRNSIRSSRLMLSRESNLLRHGQVKAEEGWSMKHQIGEAALANV